MASTPLHALVVAVVVVVVSEIAAASHKDNSFNIQGSGEARAARIRREQEKSETDNKTLPSGIPDTEPTTVTFPPCTGNEEGECDALPNSICVKEEGICKCTRPNNLFDVENQYCGKATKLGEKCMYTSECAEGDDYSVCNDQKVCACGPGFSVDDLPQVGVTCIETSKGDGIGAPDPAMIGVLAGLALMFVIICVVLRLFSKARFRENRSIFNTPNPRLMNASLFKDSKLLSPARGDRRGSRASVRVPSRAASITSVNAASRSPNGSLAKGRRGSALSTASATGSTHGHTAPGGHKTPSPVRENKKAETTVAIETVD
ncbi:uncharacterized protein LOC123501937 isoform X2 [Portunus trituberculatus]|uniref:uncharacterized protein LOC123501937 isoform X2 n=1 Tax=Portunus trituberculatus TaxID=210409 RepID=UPI001E1D0288|nr:uncharacterized protein LOC123501937 isoform X2 [Portunus trituberculatus]